MEAGMDLDPQQIIPNITNGNAQSWTGVVDYVKKRQRRVGFSQTPPSSFCFRQVPEENECKLRLYFLGIPPRCRESTLMFVDVGTKNSADNTLEWKQLSSQQDFSCSLSKDEQLARERKRISVFGITAYDYADNGHFIFSIGEKLYYYCDKLSEEDTTPYDVVSTGRAVVNAEFCPVNPNLVAFVSNSDIWVINLSSSKQLRLTFTDAGSDIALTAGVPSFVVQEEFDRYTGYWWQGSPASLRSNVYRILYEEVDESDVELITVSVHENGTADEARYPRAGKANAISTLKIVEFELSQDGQFSGNVTEKCLAEPLSILFPWAEYVVRAGWVPNKDMVYAQLMDRLQTRLTLIVIPVESFVPISSFCANSMDQTPGAINCKLHVIHEESSDIWINVHNVLHFTHVTDSEVNFVWCSEKSGYCHLYHITSKLNHITSKQNGQNHDRNSNQEAPDISNERVLTTGDWVVLNKEVWVDDELEMVYFLGLKDNPLQYHLYVISYAQPSDPVRLTDLGFSHSISFSPGCSYFVDVYSSAQNPPLGKICRVNTESTPVICDTIGSLITSTDIFTQPGPELFDYDSKAGHKAYGMFYRPDVTPDTKCPTILSVYGGPQIQYVSDQFLSMRNSLQHMLAARGFAVVMIDGRGSNNRGLQFEAHIKHRLGRVEIEDQVEGLIALAEREECIDIDRVAIFGWSYGGYLSLMGLIDRPDIFKIAIAGAPVVDWKLYDTAYTERYMGLPEDNAEGYEDSKVTTHIDRFPDQENRLLIIHGLMDENVHFSHTMSLVSSLINKSKPHQLEIYPHERHGIRNHEANVHYRTKILTFLQKYL